MGITSRTGLLASPTKKLKKAAQKPPDLQLKPIAVPAPFTYKPYAVLYNPYPYGCSFLCNHPADGEARKMINKAKENWSNDGKPFMFPDDVAAIRAELEQIQVKESVRQQGSDINLDSVPEELFRRYTETDSRPLTPAPTLVSAHTRASAARRCVTPDPFYTSEIREKTLLVLDLRRSHSQETLSWYGTNQTINEPPLIRVMHVGTRPESPSSSRAAWDKRKSPRYLNAPGTKPKPKIETKNKNQLAPPAEDGVEDEESKKDEGETSDEEFVKRRGRRRRKKQRASSRGSIFRTSVDPETLVAGVDPDSQNPSARPSIIPGLKALDDFKNKLENSKRLSCLNIDSFLDYETLRQLRRELTAEMVEFEFNFKRRQALQEALKTVPKIKVDCDELINLQKEINLPIIDTEFCLSLPRMFTRRSARFELPMDSREFNTMTPIQYLKENVWVSSARKLLYNCIFNIFKTEFEDDEVVREREMLGNTIPQALDIVMGIKLSPEQARFIHDLIAWDGNVSYDFMTFCGICAFCERILAKDFFKKFPDRSLDPCSEVERVDFESLKRRLHNKTTDERLVKILELIKNA